MILAIDLGGQSAKVGLLEGKTIIQRWTIPTILSNIWKNIFKNLDNLDWKKVTSIGISMPGFIDPKTSFVKLAGNLNLKNYDAIKAIKEALGNKIIHNNIFIINDANAATLGEYWIGQNQKIESMIMYTIGTGVGGGIILNGKIFTGKDGYAGEFGHAGNFQNEWKCTCSLPHCLEPLSSATGITKLLNKIGIDSIKNAMPLLKANDPNVISVFKKALEPLANHISIMQTAINPELIVIGGGPSQIGEPLLNIINDLIKEKQLDFIFKSSKVVIAKTFNDAGIYGAAYLAKQNNF